MGESLTARDRTHLAGLNKKLQVVRDRVTGVATKRHTGLFLGGRGGICKSHTIEDELQQRGVPYKLWNSAVTARCLFDNLAEYPEAVHLIEDVEDLTSERRAVGVLRSALWGTRRNREGQVERLVTWNAHRASSEFVFTGGIIMTSNCELADLPTLKALKTRISWMHLRVTDEEIAALMRSVALDGYPKDVNLLGPEECSEVVELIINESMRLNRRLDMRLMVNSFEDRLQADDLDAGCDWEDLVAARVLERPSVLKDIEAVGVREQKKAERLRVARRVEAQRTAPRVDGGNRCQPGDDVSLPRGTGPPRCPGRRNLRM